MAVYTDVSFEELEVFLAAYALGEPHVRNVKPLVGDLLLGTKALGSGLRAAVAEDLVAMPAARAPQGKLSGQMPFTIAKYCFCVERSANC